MIVDLLTAYASWLTVGATLFWMGSILYRTTRDTLNTCVTEDTSKGVGTPTPRITHIPARPTRIPMTAAA